VKKNFILIFFSVLTIYSTYVASVQADVIYQAFNEPFNVLQSKKLQEIKELGFTHIQISPPQKSNSSRSWWGRYQPIDFQEIQSPLGNEKELQKLISLVHKKDINLKIIIDVVLNHMANEFPYTLHLKYPYFSRENFHPKKCIKHDFVRQEVIEGWLGCDLPDLKTETSYVREQAKKYLTKLVHLGADGFRFDAARNIEPDFFREVLKVIPPNKYNYGEVVGNTINESFEYINIMDVTDFHLLDLMIQAFRENGDLRTLINPAKNKIALPGESAVIFARNHDTAMNTDFHNFDDYKQATLANAYILSLHDGLPFIYKDDAKNDVVKAGIKFHELMLDQPQFFRNGNEIFQGGDNPNLLFIERGSKGIVIINKSKKFLDVKVAKMPGLELGVYTELQHKISMNVNLGQDGQKYIMNWGKSNRGGFKIGPQTSLFFIKQLK